MRLTVENFDQALDAGEVRVQMLSGRWWAVRRNGKTRRWKRDLNRVEWPLKYGLRGYFTVRPEDLNLGIRHVDDLPT